MERPDTAAIIAVALSAARNAGEFLLEKFGHIETVEFKGATNLVTEADRGAEDIICCAVRSAFPHHALLAEERGSVESANQESDYRWFVDPLDGTTNFVHGLPNFAVSLGVEFRDRLVAGVVYAPALREIFWAESGRGAYLNGERVRVSQRAALHEALLATGFPYAPVEGEWNTRQVANFVPLVRGLRRIGSAALDLAYVACGRFDGFWEMGLSPWDLAGGSLLVEEAGGRVSDLTGGRFCPTTGRILASNGVLHETIRQVLDRTTGASD